MTLHLNKSKINSSILAIFICANPIATLYGGIVPIICAISLMMLILINHRINYATIFVFTLGLLAFLIPLLKFCYFINRFYIDYAISFFSICIVSFQCVQYNIFEKNIFKIIVIFSFFYLPFLRKTILNTLGADDIDFGNLMTISYCILIFMNSLLIGIFITRNVFKKLLCILGFTIYLITLFVFGSRGALVSIIFLMICLWIISSNISLKKIVKYLGIISIPGLIIYLNFINILKWIQRILHSKDIYLIFIEKTISGSETGGSITSGRDNLASNALEGIFDSPIFGNGIASFEGTYDIYIHNVFLQVFYELGIIPVIILIASVILGLYIIFNNKFHKKYRIFTAFLFSTGVIQLFFSSSLWLSQIFWMYIGYILVVILNSKNFTFNVKLCGKSYSHQSMTFNHNKYLKIQ